MGIVRTVIWIVLTGVLVVFSTANWNQVTVTIWPDRVLDTKLPVLIIVAVLLGSLPMWIAMRTARWSYKRRLDASERQLAELRAAASRPATPPTAPAADHAPAPADLPT